MVVICFQAKIRGQVSCRTTAMDRVASSSASCQGVCDLTTERDTLLPEGIPFDIPEYFRHVGAEKPTSHSQDAGNVQPQRYSSIFQWFS